ncbi:MAG: rRNA maturation RNase YbeY [Actinomycetota bacterium]|nr:rRNA maturation RNase YbeY [Actinomycetota bacterium]
MSGPTGAGGERSGSDAFSAALAHRDQKKSSGGQVDVFGADEQSDAPVETSRWVRLASSVLEAEGVRDDVEVSLLFVDETAMAELNQRFLGRSGPTDVLAFPIDDDVYEGPRSADSLGPGPGADPDLADLPTILGDVVVCPAVAQRNAPDHAGTYGDEMALLVVHGVLHLLGLDHAKPDEAEKMERREQELLDRFHRQ